MEGRESPGKWFPSPKAIKHLHFCREGIKFLRDLESFPRVSTCKKYVPGVLQMNRFKESKNASGP